MTKSVKRLARNTIGRDIIVGDVHGCFTKLGIALAGIDFNPGRGDRLIHVGDLVDRGPESTQVVEWLTQPWVHAVRGNHEDMAIRWPSGNMEWGNYAANGGSWMIALDRETQLEVSAALSALPIAIEIETTAGLVGVVHAECPFASWQEFTDKLQDEGLPNNKRKALLEYALWARQRIEMGIASPVDGVRAVVVGHTPMRQSVTFGNHIYIDTMGWRGGEFTLLDASTLQAAARGMTNRQKLHAWIKQHMPELNQELQGMRLADVRIRLNAATGSNVRSCDTIEDGAAVHLAALRDLTGQP